MPEPSPDTAALAQRRRLILAQIAQLDDMRPGSLVHRHMKCGSPACRCQQDDHPGHGPTMRRWSATSTASAPRSRRKKACEEQFAPAIGAEVARLVSPDASDPLDFEAIEAAVRRQALQLAADAVARRLNRDRSDYSGPHRSCPCGREARYAGRLPKTFQSVVGPLTLERAYYYCDACGPGQFPRDRALGLE